MATLSESGTSSYPLNLDANDIGDGKLEVLLYTKAPDAILAGQGQTEASRWGDVVHDSLWVGEPAMEPLLADIESGLLKPVRVVLEVTAKAD